MLQAGTPDAQIEETHLAHVPDPRQNLPGQEGSWKASPLASLVHTSPHLQGVALDPRSIPTHEYCRPSRCSKRLVGRRRFLAKPRDLRPRGRVLPAMESGRTVYEERWPVRPRRVSAPTGAPKDAGMVRVGGYRVAAGKSIPGQNLYGR